MQWPRKTVYDTVEIVQAILSGNKKRPKLPRRMSTMRLVDFDKMFN